MWMRSSKLDILGDSIRKQLGFQSNITWNVHKVILHVTRSLLVWQEMIIQAMGTPFFICWTQSKWTSETSPLIPKIMSLEITSLWPSQHAFDLPWNLVSRCERDSFIWIPILLGKKKKLFSNVHSWTPNASIFASCHTPIFVLLS